MVVSIVLAVLLFVILIIATWVAIRRNREIGELVLAGIKMKAALAEVLKVIVPHVYNRLKLSSKVHNDWPWKKLKIELAIRLSKAEDLQEVEPMLNEFLKDYLVKPGNRELLVSVVFSPLQSTGENHDR